MKLSMENHLIATFALMLTCTVFTPLVFAQDIIVALSPYQQNAVADTKQLLKQLTRLESGSKVVLLDGYRLNKLGEFNLPEGKLSPKALLRRNAKTVAALIRFAKNAPKQAQDQMINAVRLPQLLRFIAENYKLNAAKGFANGLDVVVLGSPIYDDPNEPTISMADAYIPSDGHILASLAISPYGTAGNSELFKAIRVHIGFSQDAPIINDQHHYFLRRFWTLYVENQAGRLVSFISDQSTLFDRVLNKAESLPHNFKLELSSKLEMIRLRKQQPANPIYQRELSGKPLDLRAVQQAEEVEIGISWDCSVCDLDLYAQGKAYADLLYFGHNESPMGNHWKDFRTSPSLLNGYETISFHVSLNLAQLRIAVNFFEGDAPDGVKGKLRLSVAGQTYEQPFTIKTTSGNQGGGVKEAFEIGKVSSQHTLLFDAVKIVTQVQQSQL